MLPKVSPWGWLSPWMFPRTKDHGLQAGGMWVRRGREDLIIIPKSRSDLLNSSLILFGEGFKKELKQVHGRLSFKI